MDDYEIYYQELLERIEGTANAESIFRHHGITNSQQAFYIGQSFSNNTPVAAQRLVLRDLGYDFTDEQVVSIVANPVDQETE